MPTNVPNIRFKIILSALSSKFSWWHILLAGAKICSGSTNPAPKEDLPPEVCSLAGRLLWLTRRPQSLLLLKNMKTRCILKAPEYTGRLLVLLRLAYPSNIFFRRTTTNEGRREPALGYPRSEYDWAGLHGEWRIMRWPVQRRWESSGFHLYVMGGWSFLSPSYV